MYYSCTTVVVHARLQEDLEYLVGIPGRFLAIVPVIQLYSTAVQLGIPTQSVDLQLSTNVDLR